MGRGTHLVGQAGVLRVASEIMLRGLPVLMPAVDMGVDLYVGGGVRIQVKTSRYVTPSGKCSFRLTHGYRVSSYGATYLKDNNYGDICDFVILYSVPLSKFWIVPSLVLSGVKSCTAGFCTPMLIDPSERSTIISLRESGHTWQELADKYGVSLGAVRQVVKCNSYGTRQGNGRVTQSVVREVNKYESRWDLLNLEISKLAGTPAMEVCHS